MILLLLFDNTSIQNNAHKPCTLCLTPFALPPLLRDNSVATMTAPWLRW